MSQCVLCFRCNMNVNRCTGCMTATYCDTKCQTLHCKENQYRCKAIGQRNTVEVSLSSARRSGVDCLVPPPRDQNHFIAKIQTLEEGPLEDHIDLRRSVGHNPVTAQMLLYDRSRKVYLQFSCEPQLFHLIMECGMMGTRMSVTKKLLLYFWVAFIDAETLQIFTHEFPKAQNW